MHQERMRVVVGLDSETGPTGDASVTASPRDVAPGLH